MPTTSFLAQFTGRDVTSFLPFADEALTQATLIFSIVTKRTDYPDDADQQQLAINAILQMADQIYLNQPYAQVKASPFAGETIGSYSYSKANTQLLTKARQGEFTGLFWWDLAVDELALIDRSLVASDAIGIAEPSVVLDEGGGRSVIGPAEYTYPDGIGFDINAELNPRPHLG